MVFEWRKQLWHSWKVILVTEAVVISVYRGESDKQRHEITQ